MKLSELIAHATINEAKLKNGKAILDFAVSSQQDADELISFFCETFYEELHLAIKATDVDDNLFGDSDAVKKFSESVTAQSGYCNLSCDIISGTIEGFIGINGICDGKPFSDFHNNFYFGSYSLWLFGEDLAALLQIIERHRKKEKITPENYIKEIENLFWIDAARDYAKFLVDELKGKLDKSGSAVKFKICELSADKDAPWGDTERRYVTTKICEENYALFDRIYEFCMNDPKLHNGSYAGSGELYLYKGSTGSRRIMFAAVVVKKHKPCMYYLTDTYSKVFPIIKEEFKKHQITVSNPHFDHEEIYTLKRSQETEKIFHSVDRGLWCNGCTHKPGLFSKYSCFDCVQGIFLTATKR